jgi:hypothetical protein
MGWRLCPVNKRVGRAHSYSARWYGKPPAILSRIDGNVGLEPNDPGVPVQIGFVAGILSASLRMSLRYPSSPDLNWGFKIICVSGSLELIGTFTRQ